MNRRHSTFGLIIMALPQKCTDMEAYVAKGGWVEEGGSITGDDERQLRFPWMNNCNDETVICFTFSRISFVWENSAGSSIGVLLCNTGSQLS